MRSNGDRWSLELQMEGRRVMRLLLIEDDLDALRTLTTFLRESNYSVDTADNGEDGLLQGLSWDYNVILLNSMLPKRNGWSVLEELRQKHRTIPVLMFTTGENAFVRVHGVDHTADDYLAKPFQLSELLVRIENLIRKAAERAEPVIKIGRVTIDRTSRIVMVEGSPIVLTAKEYTLLEFLTVHRGELITRSRIYHHMFDEVDPALSNLLDVYVSNIRRKVDRELITTRRGIGYIIEAKQESVPSFEQQLR